jgi:bacteriorhodopsin
METPEIKPTEKIELGSTLKTSFFVSYLVLFGYTCITLIEAIRTPYIQVRHIMNLETTVSLVAGLVYGYFNTEIQKDKPDLEYISKIRYVDWMITTPMILLVLLLFYNPKAGSVDYKTFGGVLALNAGMLMSGYYGETGALSKVQGGSLGFVFYAALLYLIYNCCIPKTSNLTVFAVFAVIWSLYGINFYLDNEETKNTNYNILDVMSKALFGIVLWLYFGNILDFK